MTGGDEIRSDEAHLEGWEKVYSSRGWGRYPPEEIIRFMARTYGGLPDATRAAMRVLDVGCGGGATTWYLIREGYGVAGIDASSTAIEKVRARMVEERIPDHETRLDLRQGNFAQLPWPDARFDVACDIEALCANRMRTIRSSIAEIHRVLKPGGRFFGKMFGAGSTGHNTGRVVEPNTSENPVVGACANFGYTHFFTEEELRDLFAPFSTLALDWVKRTDHEQTVVNIEWLVTAEK